MEQALAFVQGAGYPYHRLPYHAGAVSRAGNALRFLPAGADESNGKQIRQIITNTPRAGENGPSKKETEHPMKMKRLISFVIVLLLICGMPVSAFAMDDNQAGNTVPIIHEEETMNTNYGAVTTNKGTVTTNYGTIEINDGDVSINNGDVGTNDGDVGNQQRHRGPQRRHSGHQQRHSGNQLRHRKTNEITGDVTNYNTGNVETNNGTVTYVKDNEEITFYGVQVDGSLLQKEVGVELNLKEKFSKEGYVLAGYIMNWRMDDDRGLVSMETPKKTDDYIYSLEHPNVLTLIWMAISGSGGGSGDLDEDKGNGSAAAGRSRSISAPAATSL